MHETQREPAPVEVAALGDSEIVRRLRQRDPDGLRQLLLKYAARAKWCLRREFNPPLRDGDVDEAINVAAFRAWRSAESYDPARGSLRAWFYVIARNAAVETLRRESRQLRNTEVMDSDLASYLSAQPSAVGERSTEQARFLDCLRKCIAKLPPLQHSIIQADLRSGDVADAGDLAKTLRTSKNSIYASRSIARKRLRTAMQELGFFAEPRGSTS